MFQSLELDRDHYMEDLSFNDLIRPDGQLEILQNGNKHPTNESSESGFVGLGSMMSFD